MAYTSDNKWIFNSEYNSTLDRERRAGREKTDADHKYADAKGDLRSAEYELESQGSISQKELDWKLSRERERLFSGLDGISEELQMAIGRQNIRFREQIDRVRLDLGRTNVRVGEVNQRVSDIAANFHHHITRIAEAELSRENRARFYRNQAQVMFDHVMELHPEELAPSEAGEISSRLAEADTNLENGDFEAAIGTSQLLIPSASELSARLVILNEEYRRLMSEINQIIDETQSRLESLKKPEKNIENINVDSKVVKFDGNISFWTDGVLEEVSEYFDGIVSSVRNGYEITMDLEALRSSLEDLRQMDARLNRCVTLAHSEFYEHFRLQSLAIRIHQYMTTNDAWTVVSEESHYTDNDERRSYVLTLDNNAGLIASIVLVHSRPIRKDPRTKKPMKDKEGKVLYEETQFFVSVTCKDGSYEPELCEAVRAGVLAGLSDSDIDIGNNNRTSCNDSHSNNFVQTAVSIGNKEIRAQSFTALLLRLRRGKEKGGRGYSSGPPCRPKTIISSGSGKEALSVRPA